MNQPVRRGPIAAFFVGLWNVMNFTRRLILNFLFFGLLFLFLVLFLVVRGLPVLLLYRHQYALRVRVALAVITSAALPLVVVITEIGVRTDRMKPANAAALVGAGMLSVLIFPLVALALKQRGEPAVEPDSASAPAPA